MIFIKAILFVILLTTFTTFQNQLSGQPLNQKQVFTRQDTLRGTITPERAWWDVVRYKIFVHPHFEEKTIDGEVTITYKVLNPSATERMQIDLQEPMQIQKITSNKKDLQFVRDGNVYYVLDAPRSVKLDFSPV